MMCNWLPLPSRSPILVTLSLGLSLLLAPTAQAADKTVYQNDFQKVELDNVPEEFLVLDGDFTVKQDKTGKNRYLELPGAPLDTFGVLYGTARKENSRVSTRIYGTNSKRRYPVFGVGVNGVGGYRLLLSPAKRKLELYKGDSKVKDVSYRWKPGTWSVCEISVTKVAGPAWRVEGRVWADGQPRPDKPSVAFDDQEEPFDGKASFWGQPYSGTPIRFDDVTYQAITP